METTRATLVVAALALPVPSLALTLILLWHLL